MEIEKLGLKDKKDKIRADLIDPNFIIEVIKVLTFGANKYKANSWQNIKDPIDSHFASLMRHILYYRQGCNIDKESNLSHLSHAAANIMFLLYHERNK